MDVLDKQVLKLVTKWLKDNKVSVLERPSENPQSRAEKVKLVKEYPKCLTKIILFKKAVLENSKKLYEHSEI